MKAIWDWIVKAAQDIYSTLWQIIGFLRDKTGKYSFKRMSGVAAFIFGVDFMFRGAVIEGLIMLGYCAFVAVFAAVTGT